VPILGRPLLDFWIERCVIAGFDPIIINTHYLAEQVESFVAKSPWKDLVVLAHEETLQGTAGTVMRHREHVGANTFFVAHADNLSFFDSQDFWNTHQQRPENCLLTMMLFHATNPKSCGIVELNNASVVTAFHEKVAHPPGNLANGAVYFMEPEVFDLLDKMDSKVPLDISLDLLPQCLGRMATFLNDCYHRDIGTPESYAIALRDMQLKEG
jgi:mannose-1-phosphate guanylyltransferase